jgi:hypothetical protein
VDGCADGKPLGGVTSIALSRPSLREARGYLGRRGNPELREQTPNCRTSLAMTEWLELITKLLDAALCPPIKKAEGRIKQVLVCSGIIDCLT